MKGNIRHKKTSISVIIATLFAFVLMICCMLTPSVKKAGAYDGTFYFRGSPVISYKTDGRHQIRYNLIVSEQSLASNDEITVSLSSNSSEAYIVRGHEGTTLTEEENAGQSVTFPYNVLVFEEGFASVYVDMYLNIYEKGRLTATCNDTSAVSEEHTVVSAIEVALNDGTATPELAKVYDKYVGKDTTTTKESLSFFSNIIPRNYVSSGLLLQAEFEIPEPARTLLKNEDFLRVKYENLTQGVLGEHYTIDCTYYDFSVTVSKNNPSLYGYNRVAEFTDGVYREHYRGKDYYDFVSEVHNANSGDDVRISSIAANYIASHTPSGELYPNGKDIHDNDLYGGLMFPTFSYTYDQDYYFYGEILEYHWSVKVDRFGSSDPTLVNSSSSHSVRAVYRSDVINASVRELMENILTNNSTLDQYERDGLCSVGGISATTEIPIEVISKTYSDSGNYQTKSDVYSIAQASIYNKYSAINAMYNLTGINDVAYFNIVSTRRSYDSVTGNLYNMGDMIIRQAIGYDYYYDKEAGKAYLTVLYNDFLYKDFYITIRNEEGLEVNYYTATAEVKDGVATLIFDYAEIRERLYNSLKWILEVDQNSFTITGSSDVMLGVDVGEKELRVSVPVKYQSDLFDLGIHAVATIVPDEEYTVTYEYATSIDVSSDGKNIELGMEMVSGGAILLSRIINYNDYDIFMKEQGDMVEYPLKKFEEKYGFRYAKAEDVYVDIDTENKKAAILVLYDTNAVFLVKNNLSSNWAYVSVSHSTNVYTGDKFANALGAIPSGYRIDRLTSDEEGVSIDNEYDYHHTRVVLNAETHGNHIYPITVNYTDKWFVTVNWMQPYKDTPFAVKTKTDTEIRVADYPDIYTISKEDVAKILGRDNLVVTNVVDANAPSVSFDNVARYTIDITYGTASLKQIDYDGRGTELKIPLTSYVEWCNSFGEDWTILFLNTKDKMYFQFDNEVPREDLYGFFATAVFEEQVSDLNYWFRNNTGDGQMTIFSSKSVEGSKVYKFFNNMRDKGFIQKAIGTIGMMLCETIDDSNKMYHNYYFYLDGSTNAGYISNGGADNAFDNDSALENKGEDIVDGAKGLWNKFTNSKWKKVLVVALWVAGGLIVVGISWKFGRKFYRWVTADKETTTPRKKKRKKQ